MTPTDHEDAAREVVARWLEGHNWHAGGSPMHITSDCAASLIRAILALRAEDRRAVEERDATIRELENKLDFETSDFQRMNTQRQEAISRAFLAEAAVEEMRNEVDAFRDGLAAGFGVVTGDPHRTLVELGIALEAHHREHHAREEAAEAARDQALAERDRLRDIITEVRPRAECYDRALAQFGLTSDLIGYVKGLLAALAASRAEVVGLREALENVRDRECSDYEQVDSEMVCAACDQSQGEPHKDWCTLGIIEAALSANPGQGVAEEVKLLREVETVVRRLAFLMDSVNALGHSADGAVERDIDTAIHSGDDALTALDALRGRRAT